MYGFETWTSSKQLQKKLEATEMWFCVKNTTNLMDCKQIKRKVLLEEDTTQSLINRIFKREATFFSVMR